METITLDFLHSTTTDKKTKTIRNKGKSLLQFPSEYSVIDIETTGLDSHYDSIIEIAALKIKDNKIVSQYSSLVRPDFFYDLYDDELDDWDNDYLVNASGDKYYYIDSFITKLTGITNEMIASAPDTSSVLSEFKSFIENDILIGHNVNFDINFLYDTILKLENREFKNDFIDTLRISRRFHPNLIHHRLSDMTNYYKIKFENSHRALSDCLATYNLYIKLNDTLIEQFGSYDNFSDKVRKSSNGAIDISTITAERNDFDKSHPLYKKNCCFTGKLEKMKRKDAMQIVINYGGILNNSVTKKTNYLILGNNDYNPLVKGGKSRKQQKAEQLKLSGQDIEVITENVFYDMILDEL